MNGTDRKMTREEVIEGLDARMKLAEETGFWQGIAVGLVLALLVKAVAKAIMS